MHGLAEAVVHSDKHGRILEDREDLALVSLKATAGVVNTYSRGQDELIVSLEAARAERNPHICSYHE